MNNPGPSATIRTCMVSYSIEMVTIRGFRIQDRSGSTLNMTIKMCISISNFKKSGLPN